MKTTVNIRDDIFRRAKARAALLGQPLSRFMEESLERSLRTRDPDCSPLAEWAAGLPAVAPDAIKDLEDALNAADFRAIDPEMWR
ncbi:MAG: hypothetical protein O2923_01145 [Verrucomicrobia bacterium]|nr:hypothetical protein [Verrucomicrobiota bacterium]MDA1085399.1 hypothetical protein [Verrucomicrobiota bacterium]